ncbi:MAG TPA: hypothetical protein PKY59_10750 [Pyrinomonadaceae bacterium]|nr:hypothetical protein [Pyrinomonadaceae bacterium]
MIKKIVFQLTAISLMLFVLNGDILAQKATRINFKRGTSSASVSGTLKPGAKRTYVMRVREDQQINAVVSGKNVTLDNGMLTMEYNAPNGDNYIEVINRGRTATKYTMTVSIQ